jgi:acetoin utilization deacetylase AcuC-like enzyme
MTTLLFTHPDCAGHAEPQGHPEQAPRLAAVLAALEGMALGRREAPLAEEGDLLRCHPARYLDRVRAAAPAQGWAMLDPDTYMSPGSLPAALRAAGGVCAAVDAVMAGTARNAFVAARPPGHHAEAETAMGFCLFGNVAVGAMRALDHHGAGRVAVLDFDVHHGNGTQALLWDERRAFFASSHQMPLYPGTGAASETGAHGQVMNVALRPGSGGADMRAAWGAILDRARAFAPDLILVSAGFDAHADDPLAGLTWTEDDFAWLTGAICALADEVCGGRVVSALEGGYDLPALGRSAAAHVATLREHAR